MKQIKEGSVAWKVKELLETNEKLRDSDKKLIWAYWIVYDKAMPTDKTVLTLEEYMKTTPGESITRARRLIQEQIPELRGSEWVQEQRAVKEFTKGGFVNEDEKVFDEIIEDRHKYSDEMQRIRQEALFKYNKE